MAKVNVKVTQANADKGQPWGVQPVEDEMPLSSELLTSGAVSVQGTKTAPSGDGKVWYWQITVDSTSATDVWVTFGANPVAAAGTTHLVTVGSTRSFRAVPGHLAAVINA